MSKMGKRSSFIRKERDFYPTPYEAVIPLLPYLDRDAFCEPCAGDGLLIDHLEKHELSCKEAWDIEPNLIKNLKINLPNAKVYCRNSIEFIN